MNGSIDWFGRTLVFAPHPDDEILGAGGTIAKLAASGILVDVAIVTKGAGAGFSQESVARVREEAKMAHRCIGVKQTHWLDLPAAQLTEVPTTDLNAKVSAIAGSVKPKTVFVTHPGDIHLDHQRIFNSVLVACRPHQAEYPKNVLAYETLSETNWNAPYLTPGFMPNLFVDISDHIEKKLEAMAIFKSQLRESPHERSITALRALATLRGATVHCRAAEAFVLVRQVI
jgi:LmbE family N-acetylglucosaminyl deacetylase